MSNNNQNNEVLLSNQEEGFNLKEFIFSYLLRFWYLYVISIGFAVTLAWLKIRYSIPIYAVGSTLLIKDENTKSAGFSQEAVFQDLGLMQSGPKLLNEIQILKSRQIMESVVRKLGLDVEYYTVGRVITSELYPAGPIRATLHAVTEEGYNIPFLIKVLDDQHFNLTVRNQLSKHQFGENVQLPEGNFTFLLNGPTSEIYEYQVVFRRPAEVAPGYVGGLSINTVSNYASVLELSYRTPVPKKGIDILDTLVAVYNAAAINDKNKVGINTVQFIDDRLKILGQELSGVEGTLETYKKKNDIPTEISSSVETLISQVSEYDKEQSELEVQKSILAALATYFSSQLTQFEPAPINLLPANTQVATLVSRYNELVLERGRMLRSATADNPVVQNLTVQITTLRSSILETIRSTQQDLETGLTKIRNKNNIFRSKISTIPTRERGLIVIKRQQTIKENLYLYLLQKREETALTLAVAAPNSRVVDPAINKGGPISPNTRSIYMTALLIGLLIPSLLVYLKFLLTNTVQSTGEITAATRVPLLGAIGYKKNTEPIVVQKNSRSAMAEMFRLLRTNLQFIAAGQNNQVILVTSSISGEGKSFVALNLGITLAMGDKKTVIIELDLRKPKLIRYLTKEPAENGITSYLIGHLPAEQLVQQSLVHPNLYYIASGPIPPNPAELLLTDALQRLIEQLRLEYDYILLDTPPVGMVADALLIGKLVDSSLYIVRYAYSNRSSLSFIEELYREEKLPRMSIIFNGVKVSGSYGQQYGYGYGYGYGYYDDDQQRSWWRRITSPSGRG